MKIGIIWDLDGTLWDSSEQVHLAWNDYMQRHGEPKRFTRQDCRSYCGKTLEQIAAFVFPDRDEDWRVKMVFGACDWQNKPLAEHGGELFPHLPQVLAQLHERYHMSVVSNCGLGYIEAFFTGNHTAEFFDDYENAVRTGKGKADNIRLVMERNGLDRAIYIGDTQGDADASAQAGVTFIHARYGYGKVPDAKWAVDDPAEIPAVIAEILK